MPKDRQTSVPSPTHATGEQASPDLSLDQSGRAVLTLRGDHDIIAAVAARLRLLDGIRLGDGRLIMDLRAITAADESLMGLIALAHRLARHAGGSVCLIADDRTLIRKLQATGLDQIISRYATLDDVPDTAQ